ncbi:hypothetical protein I4699_00215 [Xanthomonas hortorum pv. carotae]|nr:hypothetical protein [Xanthomonas hortorum pv. carotae]
MTFLVYGLWLRGCLATMQLGSVPQCGGHRTLGRGRKVTWPNGRGDKQALHVAATAARQPVQPTSCVFEQCWQARTVGYAESGVGIPSVRRTEAAVVAIAAVAEGIGLARQVLHHNAGLAAIAARSVPITQPTPAGLRWCRHYRRLCIKLQTAGSASQQVQL